MKSRAVILFSLILIFSARTQAFEPSREIIAKLAMSKIDRGESVGIVVGIVHDRKRETFAFGKSSANSKRALDGKTIFEIGSISKVFTSLALSEMVQAKKVALDDPLQKYLPEAIKAPARNGSQISLRMLSNHSSALPRIIPKVKINVLLGKDPYANVTASDMLAHLNEVTLSRDPGSKFEYSNYGAGLLGTVLAQKENVTYEELILSKICRPLGMSDTMIKLDPSREARLAMPHNISGKPTKPWVFDGFSGAGAIRSTTDDMLRFIEASLGTIELTPLLRQAFDASMAPRYATNRDDMKVSLAWMVMPERAKPSRPELLWHNGGTGGFRSFLGISRSKNVGVIVLSNSESSVDELGLKVLEQLVNE
jgi:CubicO group peptidase (beta-lactamase class C family)